MMSAIRKLLLGVACLAAVAASGACSPIQDPLKLPLTFKADIQLPRDTGKPAVDLLALDTRNQRLYVPHGSRDQLDIIDVSSAKYIGSVTGLPGIKATALSADPNIVFTANATDGTVGVVDVKAMKLVNTIKIKTATSADAIEYDPVHALVIVSMNGDSVGFIDEKTLKETGTLSVGGKPELFAIDPKQGRVWLAINDKDRVLQIDPVSRSVVKTLTGCDIKAPTGLAFDVGQQRLFIANGITHTANVASAIDILLEQCLGTIDIDHGPDQAALNAHLHHLYVANVGSSNVSVIDTVSLKPLGVVGTGRQAATVATDPNTDTVWVAAARSGIIAEYHDP